MHELIGFMFWLVLLVGTSITWRVQHMNRLLWLSVLIASSISVLITGLAPGNAARSATYAQSQDLSAALRYIIAYGQALIRNWVLDVETAPALPCCSSCNRRYADVNLHGSRGRVSPGNGSCRVRDWRVF